MRGGGEFIHYLKRQHVQKSLHLKSAPSLPALGYSYFFYFLVPRLKSLGSSRVVFLLPLSLIAQIPKILPASLILVTKTFLFISCVCVPQYTQKSVLSFLHLCPEGWPQDIKYPLLTQPPLWPLSSSMVCLLMFQKTLWVDVVIYTDILVKQFC